MFEADYAPVGGLPLACTCVQMQEHRAFAAIKPVKTMKKGRLQRPWLGN
jgi:tRNA threonylcarbamoyladenosine modification (KEOPS) complex Cgi121 subunit